jgi:hypothetical protein
MPLTGAVMADTDETSVTFVREAEQAKQAVQKDVDALRPMLQDLDYASETQLLDEFGHRFAEYRELDRTILDLAVQNTNLKAQQLSYGAAQDAAQGHVSRRGRHGHGRLDVAARGALSSARTAPALRYASPDGVRTGKPGAGPSRSRS